MKKMIENLNAKMKYYKGFPNGTFRKVLEEMKFETIYEFDFDHVEVEEIIKG